MRQALGSVNTQAFIAPVNAGYVMTQVGLELSWAEWLDLGGCGLNAGDLALVETVIGTPMHQWVAEGIRLEDIVDASWQAHRALAEFAATAFPQHAFAVLENRDGKKASLFDALN